MPRWIVAVASFVVALGARHLAESTREPVALPPRHAYVPEQISRAAALGFDSLVADVVWIRYLQILPMRLADPALGRHLASQLRLVTELDPQFHSPYTQGTVLLSVLGGQPCAALEIAEAGIERFPDDWRLPFLAGYNCYFEIGDATCGARHMQVAASAKEAPGWMKGLAARLLVEAQQPEAAVEYLAASVRLEKNAAMREVLQQRLREAILTRDITRLEEHLRAWRLKNDGALPESLSVLVRDGLIDALPPDPFGGQYQLDRGRIVSSTGNRPLRAFRTEASIDIEELALRFRVYPRLLHILDKPYGIHSTLDSLHTRSGDVSMSLQALERMLEHSPREQHQQLYALQARVILREELDRLQAAHLQRLRRDPRAKPEIAAIAEAAGLRPDDVYGDAYQLEDGQISPARGRNPIIPIGQARKGKGSVACR